MTRRVLRSDGAAARAGASSTAPSSSHEDPADGAAHDPRHHAKAADVSAATAYTYFSSKEHVFAEAYLDGVETLTESVRLRPPTGATAADRIAAVLRPAVKGAAATGDVVQATAIALASSDPTVAPLRPLADQAFDEWVTIAPPGRGDDRP